MITYMHMCTFLLSYLVSLYRAVDLKESVGGDYHGIMAVGVIRGSFRRYHSAPGLPCCTLLLSYDIQLRINRIE